MSWHLAALIVISGCSAKRGDTLEPPAMVVTGIDTATLSLPLDPYVISPAEFQFITQAENALTEGCARKFGVAWSFHADLGKADTKPVRHDAQWGSTDEPRARQYGYDPTPEEWVEIERQRRTNESPNDTKISPIPESCPAEARRKLYEGVMPNFDPNYPSVLSYEAESKTWADSRVVAKVTAWRKCMKLAGGFTYPNPIKAGADPAWRSEGPNAPASEREKSVATADAQCNKKVGLSDTAAAVDATYHQELVDKNRPQLAAFERSKAVVLGNAAAILGRPGPTR
ncbi:hypothetical protein [Pendulispora rubella]